MFRRPLMMMLCCGLCLCGSAQSRSYEEVSEGSLRLYTQQDWKGLLRYGKEAAKGGQDFVLLRLRLGYAAFMLGDWATAIGHYEKVLQEDSHNETAWNYIRLCRIYLNQPALAAAATANLSAESRKQQGLRPLALTSVGVETSYKTTDVLQRQDALYNRLEAGARLGWKWSTRQALAYYSQTISAPQFAAVKNSRSVQIGQWEYYGQLARTLGRHVEVKGNYHFLYTPFNNYIYYNHVGQLALQYTGSNWSAAISGAVAQLTDSTLQQFDATLSWYPLGNLDLYLTGTGTWNSTGNGYNVGRIVAGGRLLKGLWLEGNATIGSFRNLIENEALYVYHAIDPNRQKAGITAYWLLGKVLLHGGYTYEERSLAAHDNYLFHQHSITGGFTWKF